MESRDDFDGEVVGEYLHMMMFDNGTMEIYAEEVRAMVNEDGERTPENSTLASASQLPNNPKLKSILLKRAANLPADDGDGRKKVSLNTLGEKSEHIGLNIESGAEERPQNRAQTLATEKDKGKAKHPKRKARDPPPFTSTGRVST